PGGSANAWRPLWVSTAASGPRWPYSRRKRRLLPGDVELEVPHDVGGQPPQSQACALGTAARAARDSRVRARRRIAGPLVGVIACTPLGTLGVPVTSAPMAAAGQQVGE